MDGAFALISCLGVFVLRVFVITFIGYDKPRYFLAVELGLFAAWYGADGGFKGMTKVMINDGWKQEEGWY